MKYHRLSAADFKSFRPARRSHAAHVSLSRAPSADGRTHAAYVVSKKVSTKAVVRNRVKRRLREALRPLPLPSRPLTLVFTAKRSAADARHAEIARDVRELMRGC
jgi:ribonuclease P protein component